MNLTSPTDTLVCDTTQLARWQSDPAYNYNRELIAPEINLFEWINKQFGEFLREIFGSRFADEYSELILVCIAVVILLLVSWFVYKKRPELFMRSGKRTEGKHMIWQLPMFLRRYHCLIRWKKIRFTESTFRKGLTRLFLKGTIGRLYGCFICRH